VSCVDVENIAPLQLTTSTGASELELSGGFLVMLRFALYLGGVSAAVAAWVFFGDQKRANRRVPVKKAAAMLQEAWADHHTQS
jgi:hypothetical protein